MTGQRSTVRSIRPRTAAAAGALLLAASLAACSGGAGSSAGADSVADSAAGNAGGNAKSSAAGSGRAAAPQAVGGLADSAGTPTGGGTEPGTGTGTDTGTQARVLPTDRKVVYRGSISVRVSDIGRAADRAEALATGADGVVGAEQTATDPRRPRYGEATLTLRVPPAAFGATLDALGRLGKELDRQRSAEDVTSQVIDVDSRVRTQQRSVERMRVLLSQAKTIGEVVQVESELSRREADLESLEAQLKGLEDVTDLATIEVSLSSPRPGVPPEPKDENLGFLAGLTGGWDAFVAIVAVGLTVLGALVPFALAVALVGVPLLLLWRSRRRTSGPPSAPAGAADA